MNKLFALGLIAIGATGCMATNPYTHPSPTTRQAPIAQPVAAKVAENTVCKERGFECFIEADRRSSVRCTAIVQYPDKVGAEAVPCHVRLQAGQPFYELNVGNDVVLINKTSYDGVSVDNYRRPPSRTTNRNSDNYRYIESSLHEAAPVQTTVTYDYRTNLRSRSRSITYSRCMIRVKTPDRARFNNISCRIESGQLGEKWINYSHQGERASFPLSSLRCKGLAPPIIDTPFFRVGFDKVNSSSECTFRGPDPFQH